MKVEAEPGVMWPPAQDGAKPRGWNRFSPWPPGQPAVPTWIPHLDHAPEDHPTVASRCGNKVPERMGPPHEGTPPLLSGRFPPSPGWQEELISENIQIDFLFSKNTMSRFHGRLVTKQGQSGVQSRL